MILTVEEAATRRCQESYGPPLTQGGYTQAGAYSTITSVGMLGTAYAVTSSPSHCIGPQCMAWTWVGRTGDGMQTGCCGKVR